METKKKDRKKPSSFQVTWDMVVWVPIYALLLLAIFAGISALMIWALDQVAATADPELIPRFLDAPKTPHPNA